MAPLAWSSMAARISAHRSSTVRSGLSFLARPVPAAGVLDGFQRLSDLEHRGVDLAAAEQPLGLAQEIRDAPARLIIIGERDQHLRAECAAESGELLAPPALGDADVLGDLGRARKARGCLRQEALT